MAVLNPDFKGVRERDAWRRHAFEEGLARFLNRREKAGARFEEILDTVAMLTSFETFDIMARTGTSVPTIIARIRRLVRLTIRDEGEGSGR